MNFVMKFGDRVRQISQPLLLELEQLVASWRAWVSVEHNADGTHGTVTATSLAGEQLTITGTTGNVTTLTNSYGKHIGRRNGTNAQEWHLRADSGRDNFLSFTEDGVADRWVLKSAAGSATLVFATGNAVTHTARVVLSGNDVGLAGVTPDTRLDVDAGAIEFAEMTAPSAGAANTARLFCQDNGAGKSQLCVRFNTGAIQVLATEP